MKSGTIHGEIKDGSLYHSYQYTFSIGLQFNVKDPKEHDGPGAQNGVSESLLLLLWLPNLIRVDVGNRLGNLVGQAISYSQHYNAKTL